MSDLGDIFKAYLITKNKVPQRAYTDPKNQYSLEQISGMPEYAGLLQDDAVLVDVDDSLEAELLLKIIKGEKLKCRVHKSTRGIHVFFLGHHMPKTKTKMVCGMGIVVDWKLGSRNGIAILKMDGTEREVLYDTGDIQELPAWLYPVKDAPVWSLMADGDGRNDALYQYILTLKSAGLTKEESKEVIRIINTYVLKEPLSESEINTITRDEAFPVESFYDQKGKLQVRRFEEYFCREVHAIKLDRYLHIYKDGVYITGEEAIRGRMLDYLPDLSFTQRNEILNRSKDRIQVMAKRAPAYLMLFKNGTYNLLTKELTPNDPANIITNMTPWDYNPDAYCALTDRTLDKLACGDANMRALLEEMIGAAMYRSNNLAGGKCFILLGDNSNGKSTYLHMLRGVLGLENICSISIQDMNKQFRVVMMLNKQAIIGDDIPKSWVEDPAVFKKVVTGERIVAEYKGKDGFEFDPFCTPFFSANEMPRIDDVTGAVKRRMVPIPFNAKFSPDDPDYDPDIKEKLLSRESMEYLIRVGVEALERVRKKNKYTTNDAIASELKDMDILNNPILQFLDDMDESLIINHSTEEVYGEYSTYCIESGMKPVARNSFVRQVNQRLESKVIRRMVKGKAYKVFVK